MMSPYKIKIGGRNSSRVRETKGYGVAGHSRSDTGHSKSVSDLSAARSCSLNDGNMITTVV